MNNKYKHKKKQVVSCFTQILIALMILQVIPIAFASKSNNSVKRVLAKSTNKGKNTSTLVNTIEKKAKESETAKPTNIIPKSNNNILAVKPILQMPNDLIVVRHGSSINGSRIEGSIRVLLAENTSVNSGAVITGDILTPGTPNVVLNSNVKYNGTVTGTGSAQPTNYNIILNSNTTVRHIVTRTDAITISPVVPPPQPQGTRNISLTQNQSPGDFATIRNLTLNSNYGLLTVPEGTYGSFAANSNSGFVFGVAGQSTVYNLQQLTLNSNTQLQVLGAVTINVQGSVSLNSQAVMGVAESPISLSLNISNGNLTLNSNSTMYGVVKTPNGQVSLNSNALLKGLIVCDRLTANSNSKVQSMVADNFLPVVTITSPTTDQIINTATTVVTGSFQDDSAVTLVKVNGVNAVINGNDYTATIPLTVGANTITVTATDTFGNIGTASVNVTRNATGNLAPVVNAGTDQSLTLPNNSLTLNGAVTDDGLPQPPTLSMSWSKVSSPTGGTVTFGTPDAAITTATFNLAGTYVLKLEASDSILTTSDTVSVVVTEPQQQNQAPQVLAGNDQTITLPNGVTLNGIVTDDGLPQPPSLSITWSKISGSGVVNFSSPNNAITGATFSQAGTYLLRLSASDSALTTTDDVIITVNPAQPNNAAPQVNAGQDQVITLPNLVTLQGQASDDGNPIPPGQLTLLWTKVEGNGVVNFTNSNGAITQASFSVAGTYTLRLTASDSALFTSDDVVVIVNAPANQAPLVSAGNDQTILLPETIILTGTASDDGLPIGSSLITNWSKVSGPADVTFTDPLALSTSVVFDAPGVYTLRLSATDGELTSTDEIVFTLNARKQIPLYSNGYGFDPDELTVKAGDKTIIIHNRTGLEVTYVFTQGSQNLSVIAKPGENVFIDATLEVGAASITASGHPEWTCSITVVP